MTREQKAIEREEKALREAGCVFHTKEEAKRMELESRVQRYIAPSDKPWPPKGKR